MFAGAGEVECGECLGGVFAKRQMLMEAESRLCGGREGQGVQTQHP